VPGNESGLVEPVHHLGHGALGHGGALTELLHPARCVFAFGHEIQDFKLGQADVEPRFQGTVDRPRGAEVRGLDAAPLLNQLAVLRCCHAQILVHDELKVHVIIFLVIQ
jgi:hypothetical protein